MILALYHMSSKEAEDYVTHVEAGDWTSRGGSPRESRRRSPSNFPRHFLGAEIHLHRADSSMDEEINLPTFNSDFAN